MAEAVRQLRLFGDRSDKNRPCLRCTRVQRQARRALAVYAQAAVAPSFALRTLAEEQARLRLLRSESRRLARRNEKGSRLRKVLYLVSPAGAQAHRAIEACVRRIEQLEATLLCA